MEIAGGSRHTIKMNAKPAAAFEPDHEEISEWIEAFDEVIDQEGPGQGTRLLDALTRRARQSGVDVPVQLNTPYVNTIPVDEEVPYPGDRAMERRIKSLIRWNAMAMVHRQNKKDPGIGGHISTYSSLATLLEVGYNHFSTALMATNPATSFTFRGMLRPVFMLAHFWKAASPRRRLKITVTSYATLLDYLLTRTPGSCRLSGASLQFQWDWAR